ncbi:MAG: 16S rRNA (cytosine(967)-C(5))-methyltransferase RsmB [Faecalibacterium sp.]|nr:16S rRNA (cytosine(967)-C(5))-methyltransferase RsmB [Faecalibacterium sp.]
MTARYLAVQALLHQEEGGYANLVLDAELKKHPLPDPRDRAFAGAVFYAVLEHQVTLDHILNKFLQKKIEKLDGAVRAILRSGLAQARYMGVPASAAVNEAVKLTRAFKKSSASGLVNAVLRRAIAFDGDLAAEPYQSPAHRLAVLGSVSLPVAEFFLAHYPQSAEEILTGLQPAADTALRANTLRTGEAVLCKALLAEGAKRAVPGPFPGCVLAQLAGSPADSAAFQKGFYHVEGQTSQLAALAVGAKPGETVVDLCAAPGGKTLTIAQQMGDQGTLYSCDVSENRVSLIRKAAQRMGIGCVKALCNDASVYNPTFAGADRILADVPCSGLGILAKKPDIRYKALDTLPELVALQKKILENAAKTLRPGGRLVYSTCTVNPDENQHQIKAFLAEHPEFTLVQPLPEAYKPAAMADTGFGGLSLPQNELDGFFIAALQKEQ